MGSEFRDKGAHVILGPVAGPLGRIALAGRNWEGFSPDPYLTGVGMSETIVGLQSTGVQACAKHYLLNEQETWRQVGFPNGTFSYNDAPGANISAISSNVDDRTIHELYLWPFADAVRAGVASVMCSYQRINGTYGCENSKLLNGILKEELGFQGYVMSDWGKSVLVPSSCPRELAFSKMPTCWFRFDLMHSYSRRISGATHATLETIIAGMDMEMPGDVPGPIFPFTNYFNGTIREYYANGSFSSARLDDMLIRIFTPYFYLGQDEGYPSKDPSMADLMTLYPQDSYRYDFNLTGTRSRDVRQRHADGIRALGAQAAVLLKNVNGTLPLRAPRNIGVFGSDAAESVNGLYGFQDAEIGTLPIGGGSGMLTEKTFATSTTYANLRFLL